MNGWVKLMRSPEAEELASKYPNALRLALFISWRARWQPHDDGSNLATGEALIGDYKAYGMSESAYRAAKERLSGLRYAEFRSVLGLGTVARFLDNRLFDLGSSPKVPNNDDLRTSISSCSDNALGKAKSQQRRPEPKNNDLNDATTTTYGAKSDDLNDGLSSELNDDPLRKVSSTESTLSNGTANISDDLNNELNSELNDDLSGKTRRRNDDLNDDYLESGEEKEKEKRQRAATRPGDESSLSEKTPTSTSAPASLPMDEDDEPEDQRVKRFTMEFNKVYPRLLELVTGKRNIIMTEPGRELAREFFWENPDWSALDVVYVGIKGQIMAQNTPYPREGHDPYFWTRKFTYPNRIFCKTNAEEQVLIRMAEELKFHPDYYDADEMAVEIKKLTAPFEEKTSSQ